MQYANTHVSERVRIVSGPHFGEVGTVRDTWAGWVYVRFTDTDREGVPFRAASLMLASDRTGVCTGWDLHPVERRCERIDTVPCEWCREPRCRAHSEQGSTGLHCPYPRHA